MAFRVGGVGNHQLPPQQIFSFEHHSHRRPVTVAAAATGKRRIIYIEEDIGPAPADDDEEYPSNRPPKRRRESITLDIQFYNDEPVPLPPHAEEIWTIPSRPIPNPTAGLGLELTATGLSISDDPTSHQTSNTELLEDAAAANRVREHLSTFHRRNPDSHHERVLRNIISPKSPLSTYPIDNSALESIFLSANEIFFHGRLSQRVTWDWSHPSSSPHYDSSVIGTTALRHATRGERRRGFETLIVLSSPILLDRKYSRRLLISTFLHELIHSYLFICCGFRARHCGGHTAGFKTIARLVDEWAGRDSLLYLSEMEADLSCFRAEAETVGEQRGVEGERSWPGRGEKQNAVHHHCPAHAVGDEYRYLDDRHDQHDHHGQDGRQNFQDRRTYPIRERVAYFQDDGNGYHERQWQQQDDRAAHPLPSHPHSPHWVPPFDDEGRRIGSPYV